MSRKHLPTVISILLLVFGVAFLYLPGLGSAFYYDDYSNLNGLSEIGNWDSFWEFVFSGHAGPLGRPVSLLTFALQSSAWPMGGPRLFSVNIVIHVCNSILVFLAAKKIYQATTESPRNINEFAFLAAAFWACSPILASSSLILIQRMTTLAGFFSLLALVIYLKGFELFNGKPLKRLIFQSLVLGIGTLLGMFSKENGALLPSLLLVLEITLLRGYEKAGPYRRLRLYALGITLVIFLIYLSPIARPWFEINQFREFSSWERLKGELYILWKYLYLTVAPRVAYFGPFQDQNILLDDPIKIWGSVVGLFGVVIAAYVSRKKSPWLLFAVLWFLVGHLLESTTLLLEPYFEHRNYIPLVGVAMFFAHLVISLSLRYGKVVRFAGYGCLAINAIVLFMVSSLWGEPTEAAEFWVETNPGSIRAVVHQVNLSIGANSNKIAENNAAILEVNKLINAMQLLDRTAGWCESCLSVHLQALTYSCIVEGPSEIRSRIAKIESVFEKKQGQADVASVDATAVLAKLIFSDRCNGLVYSDVDKILDEMLSGERYPISAILKSKIYYQKATLAFGDGRYDDAEISILKADKAWPSAEPVIGYQIEFYLHRDEPSKAVELIERKLRQQENKEVELSVAYVESIKRTLNEIRNENQHSPPSKK